MSCPSCLAGGTSITQPTGTTSTIHGLPTYIASPPSGTPPKAIIVLITDAFGWDFVNNRVLADRYAQRGGFLVYVPDFMKGKAMSPIAITLMDNLTTPAPSWLSAIIHKPICAMQLLRLAIPWKSACAPEKTHPGVLSFLQCLRNADTSQGLRIGIAAFCWGGKHAFMLANNNLESNLADCIFTAHPSYVSVPAEVQSVDVPMSVIVGDVDAVLKKPQAEEMQRILEGKEDCEMVILEGAKHGFAIRTHPDDEVEMEMALRAEDHALAWFGKWLVDGSAGALEAVSGTGVDERGLEG